VTRQALASALLAVAALLPPARARAYCDPESSPCYRWDRYQYNGTFWCRHWNYGARDEVYCMNSTPDIGPLTFRDAASAVYQGWASQAYCVPQLTFSALPAADTTNVSYMMFVDDATWSSRGFNPNAAGVTYRRVFADGTVAHGRTWYHLKSTSWGWSPDCLSNDCTPNPPFSPGRLDFPSVAAHELGHWWVLLDISATGCEYVLMWQTISVNQVRRDPQFPDVYGATLLCDQPVDVAVSLAASDIQPDRVSITWFLADPGRPAAAVERRTPAGAWETRAMIAPDGVGYLRFTDAQVTAGGRYGYRLRVAARAGEEWSGETWVDVPKWALALDPVRPNPVRGSALEVRFVLPDATPASLDVVDVTGRIARRLDFSLLGRGSHVVRLDDAPPLPAGVYWLRLRQGTHVAGARAVVIR
jgi:hypothetical protein